jgi:hypothetical protein
MGLKDLFRRRATLPPKEPELWPRPNFEPGGATASFEFFCFSAEPIPAGAAFDLGAEGYRGSELPVGTGMRTDVLEEKPELFESILRGPWGESLRAEHPELASQIAATRFIHNVVGDVPDPSSLEYLQGAWAAVRWFARHGAYAVRDTRMASWRTRDQILATPDTDPTLACGYRVLVETQPEPGFGHLIYTNGLSKFGRPDLIATAPERDDIEPVRELMNNLAWALALGRRPRNPPPGIIFEAYAPGLSAPSRDFFNDEVVLVRFDPDAIRD